MRNPFVLALLGVLIAGGAFVGGLFVQNKFALIGPPPGTGPVPNSEPAPNEKLEVRSKALIEYLDGKPLKDKEGKSVMVSPNQPGVFRKGDITAVQFADTASRVNSEPWGTTVTVLAKFDDRRYAVHASVKYWEVEKTIAIMSFTPTEVSPQ